MHPVAQLLWWQVPTYGLLALMGLVAGLVVAHERGRRDGWAWRDVVVPGLAAEAGGVIGAPLWSAVVEQWALVGAFQWQALVGRGGLSIVGGLSLGAFAGWVAVRWRGMPFVRWLDVAAPGAAIGVAFGRLGCFFNGCCYGRPTLFPVAVVFEHSETAARPLGVPLHPTQLYAAAGLLLLAVVLWHVRAHPPGRRAGWFLVGYAVLRVGVETLRADYRGYVFDLPATAVAASVIGLVGVALVLSGRAAATPELGGTDGRSTETT
ncbi:MAG: prolipoprotein diacylglyceryl transferase [Myxococcota bacterium]